MTAQTLADGSAAPPPRFDAQFIEEHHLLERYLESKLPMKGARDLENWCRANPGYLTGLQLAERAQASLRLLEAIGRPLDLREPQPEWWKAPYVPVGLAVVALLSVIAFWALFGKHMLLKSQLADAQTRMAQGSLEQPSASTTMRIAPDRAPGIDHARIAVKHSTPQLIDLHIDMTYTKMSQFRMIVDKQDQGRALIVNNMLKDSNGELRLTFNTSGLAAGAYNVRIEALPTRGGSSPSPEGWLKLDVR